MNVSVEQKWFQTSGNHAPLGATVTTEGVNFAVYSPDAKAVVLCLYSSDTEETLCEIPLAHKTGDIWHGLIHGIGHRQLYAYRVDRGHSELHSSPADKLLIDPYARTISRPVHWNARQYVNDSHFMVPKGLVIDRRAYPDQRPHKPGLKPHQRVVYEAHMKGLTQLHPKVPAEQRGKYLGACHPAVLSHLKMLGVTSVQFLPLAACMPEPYITEKGMTNYWGYNPVSFFAPEPRYAQVDALDELRTMVDRYHEAGLEVIVDVVFNHTAEGGKGGPVLSFKGFCPYQAYLYEQAPNGELFFSNHSGCGNSINSAQPMMMKLILDALRFWLTTIGVDGFRFDLAASLGREPQQFTKTAGILRAMQQDPVISQAVLIAEPWDIGPGGYQLGSFNSDWLEVNDKYRDNVRAFWRGDDGMTAEFATRLFGSADIFGKGRRHINTSVNNITYHDGFTLHDLVSYSERHNHANGEENQDGHGHNLSANYGVEGPTQDEAVLALREKQKRNMFATLLLSQGTPHILGADELSKTQQGNNNAYCQDNDINWYDWELNKRRQDFLNFCSYVIALRKSSDVLSNLLEQDDSWQQRTNVAQIRWFKPDGAVKETEDWHDNNRTFGVEIEGAAEPGAPIEHWFICFNTDDTEVRFKLPTLAQPSGWQLRLDTRYACLQEQPEICIQQVFSQAPKSVAVFCYSPLPDNKR